MKKGKRMLTPEESKLLSLKEELYRKKAEEIKRRAEIAEEERKRAPAPGKK